MNLCVVVPELNLYSETFIRAHLRRLPATITTLHGGFFPTRIEGGERLLPEPGIWKRAGRSFRRRVSRARSTDEALQRSALETFLKRRRIDAVLAEYGPTGARIADVCQETGVPLVVHFHGADAYDQRVLQDYGAAYQSMFVQANAVIAVSAHMRKQLLTLGSDDRKLYCNPCGMDADLFHGAAPLRAPPHFLATGRFVDKKAPHLTILAFSKVLSDVPDARLFMVGDGPLLHACHSLVKALGIAHAVRFLGAQSHAEVAQLMRQVRAFVQHSVIAATGDCEGTPVAVLEAGGAGLPVVATRHTGIGEVVEHDTTGFLVEEHDIEDMARRMATLAVDPALAAEMGRAAQARVLELFTLDTSIARLSEIICAAVRTHRQRLNA